MNSDIDNFNQYSKVNVDGLKASGERTDDLIINLFKDYHVASDGKFVRYTKTKQDKYNDGYSISRDEKMTSALKKIEILTKDNTWKSMYPEQEQITALASVV